MYECRMNDEPFVVKSLFIGGFVRENAKIRNNRI